MQPLYDIARSFQDNIAQPLAAPEYSKRAAYRQLVPFFDYTIQSRIGASACPVMHSAGIATLAQLGYDVLTYKTIRSAPSPVHPLPNILYAHIDHALTAERLETVVTASARQPHPQDMLAIANSFGNASESPDQVKLDIAKARAALGKNQVLQVSIYGEGKDEQSIIQSFVTAALCAYDAGAQVIELNLSCPNIVGGKGLVYNDLSLTRSLVRAIVQAVPHIPVTAKTGIFTCKKSLHDFACMLARSGARGICGINSVPMRIVDTHGLPAFGENRPIAGISGAPIRPLAHGFVTQVAQINHDEHLCLTIIGVGGVTSPEHFDDLLTAGADIALSATGMMWRPTLAQEYHTACANKEQAL